MTSQQHCLESTQCLFQSQDQGAERSYACQHHLVCTGTWNAGWLDQTRMSQCQPGLFPSQPSWSQWQNWQGAHSPQEGPLHHCPGSYLIQVRILHQGDGPPCVDQQVPPQSTARIFSLKRSHRSFAAGFIQHPSLLLPLSICLPKHPPANLMCSLEPSSSYLRSNLTPKEVVFWFIYLFASTSFKWISKEFHNVFYSSFPSVYWVPISFWNDTLNLALRAMKGGCSRQCWVTTGCNLP
mgnify:CR=1 FL=1